jgi:hypothetical protein
LKISRIVTDSLGFAPALHAIFACGSTRFLVERIGGWALLSNLPRTSKDPGFSEFADQARKSDVIQDSDFRTEIGSRKNMRLFAVPPCVRRTTENFATSHHFQFRLPNT